MQEEDGTLKTLQREIRRYTEARHAVVEAEGEMLLGIAWTLAVQPAVEPERAPTPEWLTVKQGAEHLGLSQQETYRRIARREIPAHSLGPQSIRLNRHELDEWLMTRPYT